MCSYDIYSNVDCVDNKVHQYKLSMRIDIVFRHYVHTAEDYSPMVYTYV